MDNSPSLGNTTINSLFVSDYAIVPADASSLSFRALGIFTETVKKVQAFNKDLKDMKALITMYDGRANHCKEVSETLNENITDNDINIVTNGDAKNDISNVTNNVIKTDNITIKYTNMDTKKVNEKNITKKVTIIKTISIGKKEIVSKFTSDKCLRPNYNLSEDTVEKIEKISDILGYKKTEFIDIFKWNLRKIIKKFRK